MVDHTRGKTTTTTYPRIITIITIIMMAVVYNHLSTTTQAVRHLMRAMQ